MELSSKLVSAVFPEFHRVASSMIYTTTFYQSGVSNTRKSASSGYLDIEKWLEKTRRSRVFLTPRGVWIPDESLFRVFDMASQTTHNSWRNSKQKFAKFHAN